MGKIAFVFSGQGSQYVGMGKDLYDEFPVIRDVFEKSETIVPGLTKLCFEGPKEKLFSTINTQPCMLVLEIAIAFALEKEGIKPDFTAGFSLGEISSICYSKAIDFKPSLELTVERAKQMEIASKQNPGMMAAILKIDSKKVVNACSNYENVWAVNFNCPNQTVISGEKTSVSKVIEDVSKLSGRGIELAVSGAFHSPFMVSASSAIKDYLTQVNFSEPMIPIYTNVTGKILEFEKIKETISKHISSPVLWEESIKNMIDAGVDTFIEIGPGKVLSGLIKKIDSDVKTYNVSCKDTFENILMEIK